MADPENHTNQSGELQADPANHTNQSGELQTDTANHINQPGGLQADSVSHTNQSDELHIDQTIPTSSENPDSKNVGEEMTLPTEKDLDNEGIDTDLKLDSSEGGDTVLKPDGKGATLQKININIDDELNEDKKLVIDFDNDEQKESATPVIEGSTLQRAHASKYDIDVKVKQNIDTANAQEKESEPVGEFANEKKTLLGEEAIAKSDNEQVEKAFVNDNVEVDNAIDKSRTGDCIKPLLEDKIAERDNNEGAETTFSAKADDKTCENDSYTDRTGVIDKFVDNIESENASDNQGNGTSAEEVDEGQMTENKNANETTYAKPNDNPVVENILVEHENDTNKTDVEANCTPADDKLDEKNDGSDVMADVKPHEEDERITNTNEKTEIIADVECLEENNKNEDKINVYESSNENKAVELGKNSVEGDKIESEKAIDNLGTESATNNDDKDEITENETETKGTSAAEEKVTPTSTENIATDDKNPHDLNCDISDSGDKSADTASELSRCSPVHTDKAESITLPNELEDPSKSSSPSKSKDSSPDNATEILGPTDTDKSKKQKVENLVVTDSNTSVNDTKADLLPVSVNKTGSPVSTEPFDWSSLGVYRCSKCNFTTDNEELHKNHVTTCTTFRNKFGEVVLVYRKGTPASYICENCKITWVNKAEFEEHVVCHIVDSPYLCITCKRHFPSRFLIEKHAKNDHPLGDSKCALRGMKKCRQFVSAVEVGGQFTFSGKLTVPRTPRNQIKDSQNVSLNSDLTNESNSNMSTDSTKNDNETKEDESKTTAVATMPSPRPNLGRFKDNSVTSNVTDEQSGQVAISSIAAISQSGKLVVPTAVNVRSPTSVSSVTSLTIPPRTETVNTLFQVLDNQDGKFHPAPLPRKIQELVNVTSSNSNDKAQPDQGMKAPQYHVKQFKEFTQPQNNSNPTVTTVSTPVLLIPVDPRFALNQPGQQGNKFTPKQPSSETYTPVSQVNSGAITVMNQPKSNQFVLFQPNSSPPTRSVIPTSGVAHTTLSTVQAKQANPLTAFQTGKTQWVETPTIIVQHKPPMYSNVTNIPSSGPQLPTMPGPQLPTMPILQHAAGPQPPKMPVLQQPANVVSKTSPGTQTPIMPFLQQPAKVVNISSPGQQPSNMPVQQPVNAVKKTSPGPHPLSMPALQHSTKAVISFPIPLSSRMTVLQQPADVVNKTSPSPQPMGMPALQKPIVTNILPETIVANVTGLASTATNQSLQTEQNQGNEKDRTFTFRIKPQKGFVCECCRKYTRDELVFRKHIWEHFHVDNISCKYCKIDSDLGKKGVLGCKLVNEIVCKLVKNTVSMVSTDKNEVIDITGDDDDDSSKNDTNKTRKEESKAIEVIVLDDEESDKESDSLNIKITSAYSLSDSEYLEKMSKDIDKTPEEADSKKDSKASETKAATETVITGDRNSSDNDMDTTEADIDSEETETTAGTELVNKTLAENVVDLDDVVSKTIDKVFESSKDAAVTDMTKKKDDSKSAKDEAAVAEFLKNELHDKKTDGKKLCSAVFSRSNSTDSKKSKFESGILAKQSYNAFYMCGLESCSFSCLTSVRYKEHLQTKHAKEFNFVCCHCGRKDYNEDSHVRHLYTHASTKTFYLYTCPMRKCKYKTNLAHMYLAHLKRYDDLNNKCVYCHKIFSTSENLVSHLNQNLLKFVSCPHCPFKFVNRQVVMKHIKLFHVDKPRMVTVTCQIVCLDREINFYVEPLVRRAMVKDTDKAEPPPDTLSITALLDKVQKDDVKGKDDSNTENMYCPVSENSTSKKQKHMAEMPVEREKKSTSSLPTKKKGGPKSLKCPHCTYLSYNLPLHVQHVSLHANEPEREKRFVCNLCPKGSDIISHFKKHVLNHIGKNEIKIFSCTSCAYATNLKCHIMDHCSDNHGGKGMYVQSVEELCSTEFSCKFCSFKARQQEHVQQHEEIVHKVKASDPKPMMQSDKDISKHDKDIPKHDKDISKHDKEISKQVKDNSKHGKGKLKYHCEYCKDKFFKHKAELKDHMEKDHSDIEHKQFVFYKCKYCSHTSTMKAFILVHIEKVHPGCEQRLLRKIESVECMKEPNAEVEKERNKQEMEKEPNDVKSSDKETIPHERVGIPDGNTFKHPFQCPKCSFSSNLRIKVMRHIKCHKELRPVREGVLTKQDKPSKMTARKSTGGDQRDFQGKKHGALFQEVPDSHLQNPFTSLKKNDTVESNDKDESPYVLGGKELHAKLSACFIPLEIDVKFQCRICQQKISKMFVLHRHILDHLEIVFFKCKFCTEGSIEKTLLFGHIQKEHPQKPVEFSPVMKEELDLQFKEKIFSQNFNDSVSIESSTGQERSSAEMAGIIMKPVHESKHVQKKNVPKDTEHQRKEAALKCPHCKFTCNAADYMEKHVSYHSSPLKKFVCTICDFRGSKYHVVRHSWAAHGQSKYRVDDEELAPSNFEDDNKRSPSNETDDIKGSKNAKSKETGKTSRVSREHSVSSISSAVSKGSEENSVKNAKGKSHIIKTLYKCKECGLNRQSISSMYRHMQLSKACSRPTYKCSLCSYKSTLKMDIAKHKKIRHAGQTAIAVVQPMKAKIRTVKIPIFTKNLNILNQGIDSSTKQKLEPTSSQEKSSLVRCRLCHHSCDSTMTLQYHINTSHGGQMLYCQECQYKTPIVKHMINHCTNVHMQKEALYRLHRKGVAVKTSDDDNSSLASTSVNEDSKSLMNFGEKANLCCPECKFESNKSSSYFRRHLLTHFSYQPYQCHYCLVLFSNMNSLKRHIGKFHPGKPIKFKFTKDDSVESKVTKLLNQAKKQKTKEDMESGVTRPVRLDKLELVETGVRKDGTFFYCDFCGFKQTKKFRIRRHYESTHGEQGQSFKKRKLGSSDLEVDTPPRKMPKLEPMVKNDLDVRTSGSSDSEDDGEKSQPVKYSVVMGTDGRRQFKCFQCKYMTDKKIYLQKHIKRHSSSQYKCVYCSFTSRWQGNAYRHVKNRHPGMEIKVINMKERKKHANQSMIHDSLASASPRTFTDSAKLGRKLGKGNIVYCCRMCSYRKEGLHQFSRHLAKHPEFTSITMKKSRSCGYCSYVAVSKQDYSIHLSTHLQERRFKCAYCNHTGFVRTQVLKHSRSVHENKTETCIDRERVKIVNETVVQLDPIIKIKRITAGKQKSKKYKRIKLLAEESSDEGSDESSFSNTKIELNAREEGAEKPSGLLDSYKVTIDTAGNH